MREDGVRCAVFGVGGQDKGEWCWGLGVKRRIRRESGSARQGVNPYCLLL